ncbi:MAG: hypothetical protein ACRD3V_31550 [Vicinamibacteria bacterium]
MRHLLIALLAAPVVLAAMPPAASRSDAKRQLADSFLAEKERAAGRALEPEDRKRVLARLTSSLSVAELETLAYDPEAAPDIVGTLSLGDSLSDLVFTPVPPCRIIDTRLSGGTILANTSRAFFVTGTTGFPAQGGLAGGCGVPDGATAAVLNLVAVTPPGPGNLRAYPYDEPEPPPPNASVLNFGPISGLNALANGTVVPLCDPVTMTCSFDLLIYAAVSNVDVVVDVSGYFSTFPTADIVSTVLANDGAGSGLDADLLDGFHGSVYQRLVFGACTAGSSIRDIDATGTVTCEPDDVGTGDITEIFTAGDSGLNGGVASGLANLTVDPSDFNGTNPMVDSHTSSEVIGALAALQTLSEVTVSIPASAASSGHVAVIGVANVGCSGGDCGPFSGTNGQVGWTLQSNGGLFNAKQWFAASGEIVVAIDQFDIATTGSQTFYFRSICGGPDSCGYDNISVLAFFIPD